MKNILFTPINIGNVRLKNRIMFPPVTTGYEQKGLITDKSIAFYEEIAKGGAGLIILGDVAPVKTLSPIPMLANDEAIPSFKKLTDAVHKHGAKIGAQIFFPEYDPQQILQMFLDGDMQGLRKKLHHDMEHFVNEVTVPMLQKIKGYFIEAAIRADKAGFDVIQIHGDRLIGVLSSPILNKRADLYGGAIENRGRFALEIVEGIRKALPYIAIDYKLALIKTNPSVGKGGPTIEEGQWLAKELVKKGVNSFHVCQANHSEVSITIPAAATMPFMCFIDYAEAIKKSVNVPVSAVGRIVKPEHALYIIENNIADIVALGRAQIADPYWASKVANNESASIRTCIMCNKGCTDKIIGRSTIQCAINPENGQDIIPPRISSVSKKVLVIGGGPAGMQAAITAKDKGHDVVLYEQNSTLGGQLNIAVVPPHKVEMKSILDFLTHEIDRQRITVFRNAKVTEKEITDISPDYIILATGATVVNIKVPGHHQHVVDAWDVLSGTEVGDEVVVIGGGSVGVETAEYLGSLGKKVSIVEMTNELAKGEGSTLKPFLMSQLNKYNVKTYLNSKLLSYNQDSIMIENTEIIEIKCNSVVLAVGSKSNTELLDTIVTLGVPHSVIGDAVTVRLLENAIREGYIAGYRI